MKNRKIALLTDIHFGLRGGNKYFHDKLFLFIEDIFLPYLKKHKIIDLLILGDTFDKRKNVDFFTLHETRKRFFDVLAEYKIDIKIIYGNHDTYFKNTNEVNSIDLLIKDYSNVEVVKTHKVFDYEGVKIGMISWINPSILTDSLNWIRDTSLDILCGHFEINGFEVVKGHLCETGFSKVVFEKFERVFSGHFHIKNTTGKLCYLGNPLETNWGDYGLEKGFHVFNTSNHKLDFVKNPHTVYKKIFIKDEAFDIVNFDYESYKDNIVKIQADLSNINLKRKLDLFFDKLNESAFSVEVENLDANKSRIKNSFIDLQTLEETDTLTLIKDYITEIELKGVDKQILYKSVESLYNQSVDKSYE